MTPETASLINGKLDAIEDTVTLMGLRIAAVRKFCQDQIDFDAIPNGLTNRAWAAESVLNILDGKIDAQLMEKD